MENKELKILPYILALCFLLFVLVIYSLKIANKLLDNEKLRLENEKRANNEDTLFKQSEGGKQEITAPIGFKYARKQLT